MFDKIVAVSALLAASLSGCILISQQDEFEKKPLVSDLSSAGDMDPSKDMGMDPDQSDGGCAACSETQSCVEGEGAEATCECKEGYFEHSVTGDCFVPVTCAEAKVAIPPMMDSLPVAEDGLYVLGYNGDPNKSWVAWCDGMNESSSTPREYLPLAKTTGESNTFEIRGGAPDGDGNQAYLTTSYHMIRVDPTNGYRVDITDRTHARTTVRYDRNDGELHQNLPTYSARGTSGDVGVDFGTVSSCGAGAPAMGTINLEGTPFKVTSGFSEYGLCPNRINSFAEPSQNGYIYRLSAVTSTEIRTDTPNMPAPWCASFGPEALKGPYGLITYMGECDEPAENMGGGSMPTGIPNVLQDPYVLQLEYGGNPTDGRAAMLDFKPRSCPQAFSLIRRPADPMVEPPRKITTSERVTLYVDGREDQSWEAYCDVRTPRGANYPIEFLMLGSKDLGASAPYKANAFETARANGSKNLSQYSGVRIDPYKLEVDILNNQHMEVQGSPTISFATIKVEEGAMADAFGRIDLGETPFGLDDVMDYYGTCDGARPDELPVNSSSADLDVSSDKLGAAMGSVDHLALAPREYALTNPLFCGDETRLPEDVAIHEDVEDAGRFFVLSLKFIGR